jgi:hypothetical protein
VSGEAGELDLVVGLTAEIAEIVTEDMTAAAVGSGAVGPRRESAATPGTTPAS